MNNFSDRKIVMILIIIGVGFIFLLRLFYIQVIDDTYKLDAKNQAFRYTIDYPARGLIYDRNGTLLVYNEAAYDLMVLPKQVKDIDTMDLCNSIGITREQFEKKLSEATAYSRYKPSIFEKQISVETYAVLQEKLYKFNGFFVQSRTLRKYPSEVAAHTLGYIGEVNPEIAKQGYYREGDYIGISGIEKSYEKELRGQRGVRIVMVDVHNREKGSYMNGIYDTLALPGKNLMSTLDAELQAYGELLMQNKKGSVVAIEPSTGEILAAVTSPSYNPNLLVGRDRTKNYGKLLKDTVLVPLFNRALMAYYPPGSTFKLINGLIGQQEGVLRPETRYPCARGYPVMGGRPGCHPHASPLDLSQSVQHSCNSYYCYVFRSIIDNKKYKNTEEGYQAWRDYVMSFGIGRKLNTDLPQELRGMVPSVKYYDKYFGKGSWKSSTIVSLSIGQGELGITPLQMANIMCTIANRGYYYVPHIIKSVAGQTNFRPDFLEKNYTRIDPEHFGTIIDGMEQVVEAGTARVAKIKGMQICGKTGTAQNPHGKDHSLFVCFAPKDNPKIAIAVMVENSGFGATWAAPIASLMLEKYLNDTITRPELEKRMFDGNLITTTIKQ